VRRILGVARGEYISWITNPRIIILGILLIFIKNLAIDPLAARAEKFGDKMLAFEPFISVVNSGVLTLFIPLTFLVLFSDYPRLSGNSMFFISRTGKKCWLCGQILFMVMAIMTFIGFLLAATMLLSGGNFGTEWSEAVRMYNAKFPEEAYSFDSELLPSNLYNQIPMMRALWQTAVLLALYLLTLALSVYLIKILFSGSAGLLAALIIIALGTVTTSLYSPIKWAFPMANTIIWLHYAEIYREPIYPIWASFLYFGVLISALVGGCFFALKRLNFIEEA